MSTDMDKELEAINQIIKALDSLDVDEKKRVIEYTLTRLGLKTTHLDSQLTKKRDLGSLPPAPDIKSTDTPLFSGGVVDVRALREEKEPKTAIEMATVVAFYLSELAPADEKKLIIEAEDITKYFKQANFKLPKGGGGITLRNAKNAGYLDAAGETGTYKLNPVGYNLVAYNMPRKEGTIRKKRKLPAKTAKKNARKQKKMKA